MGKWAPFKNKLDKFQQEPEWQEKVNEAKKAYIGLDASELARTFSIERNAKRDLEAQVKLHNCELEALSQLLVETLEGSSLQKIQLSTGEVCFIQDEPFASVTDRELMLSWLRKKKLQRLLSVNIKTLNAFIKELLVEGKPIPPGTAVYLRTTARLRGGSQGTEE